jgi:hypothetical protein
MNRLELNIVSDTVRCWRLYGDQVSLCRCFSLSGYSVAALRAFYKAIQETSQKAIQSRVDRLLACLDNRC